MRKHHSLGSVEQKILIHLFYKPDEFIQWIKKAIRKDYKTVYTAVNRLVQKGYVESAKDTRTEKGRVEKTYRLNDRGIAWVLAYGKGDLTRISPVYVDSQLIEVVQSIGRAVGKESIQKLISKSYKLYLTLLEDEDLTATDVFDYIIGAMFGWLLLHLDAQPARIADQPKTLSEESIKKLLDYVRAPLVQERLQREKEVMHYLHGRTLYLDTFIEFNRLILWLFMPDHLSRMRTDSEIESKVNARLEKMLTVGEDLDQHERARFVSDCWGSIATFWWCKELHPDGKCDTTRKTCPVWPKPGPRGGYLPRISPLKCRYIQESLKAYLKGKRDLDYEKRLNEGKSSSILDFIPPRV